jgi:O-antigen ligase
LRHPIRLFLIVTALISLVIAGLIGQSVVAAHQARIRGRPSDFPAPVSNADVPMLGVNVALEQYQEEELDAALAHISEAGFIWVRQTFYRSHIEGATEDPGDTSQARFDWTTTDRLMTALTRYPQLRLIAVLDDTSPVPPTDPEQFAAFAGAFAARYGDQVDIYQVWDEPNLADRWGGQATNPPAYADLLARTARAIRSADRSTPLTGGPPASILLAGLAPTVETGPRNLSDVRFLEQLYAAGAAPYFDIVAGKPYGFHTGPDDRRTDESVLNFSRLILLREVMVAHGDAHKAVWASHWGWNALPPGWVGQPSLWGQTDEATQANLTVAALERARDEWPWVGALVLEHFQPAVPSDDAHWGFALIDQDDQPRPIYDAVTAWVAALPDGAPVGGYPASNRWTTYEGDWQVGMLGADVGSDGDRASFRFVGTSVALTVRRGPYRGFLYVTVDGSPANRLPRDRAGRAYVVLYDNKPAIATVPLATGLPYGPHTVDVVAGDGQGRWALVDWRVGAEPVNDGTGWQLGVLAAVGLALAALVVHETRQVAWRVLGQRFLGWPEWAQGASAAGLTGLLWLAAGVAWGQLSRPIAMSPLTILCLALSLLTPPALAALFTVRLDLGLALVALTAPFYLHPGRMFYRALSLPELLVVLCAVGAVGRRICASASQHTGGRTEFRMSPIDWAIVALLTAALIASLATADRQAALFELRTVFLLPALVYALLRHARFDEPAKWRILDAWVLGATAVALIGLGEYVLGRNLVLAEGGVRRLQSVYYSPNNVGLYLDRVWPLLVTVPLWATKSRRRTLYGLALLPVTLAIGLSLSRGSLLLALPAGLLVMAWLYGGRYRWLALALVVIAGLVLVPLMSVPRFASLLDIRQGSTFFRLELWRSTVALIRESPWFGVGPGNFSQAYRTRYVLPSAWQQFNLEHPHNIYLDHWSRLGLLGIVAGVAVQITFWRTVYQKQRDWRASIQGSRSVARDSHTLLLAFAGSMAALLAHGLVDNTLFFPDLALILFLTLGLLDT